MFPLVTPTVFRDAIYKRGITDQEIIEYEIPPLDVPPAKSNIPASPEGLQALKEALSVQIIVETFTPAHNPWVSARLIADCKHLLEVIEKEIPPCDDDK